MEKNMPHFLTREEINQKREERDERHEALSDLIEQEFLGKNPDMVAKKAMVKRRRQQIMELLYDIEEGLISFAPINELDEHSFTLGYTEKNPYLLRIAEALASAYNKAGNKAEIEHFKGSEPYVMFTLTLK